MNTLLPFTFSLLCECYFRDLHLDPDGHFLDGSGEPEPSVEPRLPEVRVHRIRLRGDKIIQDNCNMDLNLRHTFSFTIKK